MPLHHTTAHHVTPQTHTHCCHTTATGHTKRVTAAVWGQNSVLVTASNDKTVRFWQHSPADGGEAAAAADGGDTALLSGSWSCAAVGSEHEAEVRGLALHPSRVYGVSVSADSSWAWWDLAQARCLKQVCVFVIKCGRAT